VTNYKTMLPFIAQLLQLQKIFVGNFY